MSEHDKMDGAPVATGPAACPRCAKWKLPLLLGGVLAAIIFVNGRGVRQKNTREVASKDQAAPISQRDVSGTPPSKNPAERPVSLAVVFGDELRLEWRDIPWQQGMTVAALLAQIAETSAGDFSYTWQGTDAPRLLLVEMAGVANEGKGQRNWIYRVNGERADRSFGMYELRPGDEVLWTFEAPR